MRIYTYIDAFALPLRLLTVISAVILGWSATGVTSNESMAYDGISIQVNGAAVVKGKAVLLGEVATIKAPVFLLEGLAALELGPSPKPGKMTQVDGKKIRDMIRRHDLVSPDMQVTVPTRVFVKRDSQEIEEELLRSEAVRYLTDILGTGEFEIKRFLVRGLEAYPSGQISLVMTRKGNLDRKGRFSFQLDVMVDGVAQDRLNVKGEVSLYKSVFCAARTLKRGTVLIKDDVRLQKIDVFQHGGDYLTSFDELDQMALNTNVNLGACLERNDFKQVPVVRRGDVIKLVASKNRLSIVTLGICKEDGYADQPITVENLTSGERVRGLVRKDTTVEVVF